MTEKTQMAELARQMASLPETDVKLTTLPSGAAMLDVRCTGHLFVMAYFPTEKCFGVDEVGDDEGFLTSYRHTSGTFESAAAQLWKLVRSPRQQPISTPAIPSPAHPTIAEGETHQP